MRRRHLLIGAVACSLLVSGCSALKISTADGDSGPGRIGISSGEQDPQPEESTAAALPEGMEMVTADLGSECPIEMSLAMDSSWSDGAGFDGYQLFSKDSGAIITLNCNEDSDESPQAVIDSAKRQMFSESGSTNLGEKSGSLPGGQYWTFHGDLAAADLRAVDGEESVMYGVVGGISKDGRLYKVTVDMLAQASDTETDQAFAQMLPTVRIDDQELEAPDLR